MDTTSGYESGLVAVRARKLAEDSGTTARVIAAKIADELEARYWACRAFTEQYPINDTADEDEVHHSVAMRFALDLPPAPTPGA